MDVFKAHGTGNDFVVLRDLDDELALTAAFVRAVTDRRRGIGGDGVIRLGAPPPDQADADVFMDYRNADGSIVEMCGNGVRVAAKHVVDHGLVTPDAAQAVRVATRAGIKPVTIRRGRDGTVAEATVDMGSPVFTPADVPFEAQDPVAFVHHLDVDGTDLEIAVVSMGNPHAVTVVEDVATAPVTTVGPLVETHQRFPAKVNVSFAQPLSRAAIRLRVWERGVGETAACGTGACAAAVTLQRLGLLDDEVEIYLPGGVLTIAHHPGGTVMMTGPAVEVGRIHLDDRWLAAAGTTEMRP